MISSPNPYHETSDSPVLFAVLLLFGMLIFMETGRQARIRRSLKDEGEQQRRSRRRRGVRPLWFAMAFTFSGAASRFNEKRMLIARKRIQSKPRIYGCISWARRRSRRFRSCFADIWIPDWRRIAGCRI